MKGSKTIDNGDGTFTIETTYTEEVTTGYLVTYTVTYKVADTYEVEYEKSAWYEDEEGNGHHIVDTENNNGELVVKGGWIQASSSTTVNGESDGEDETGWYKVEKAEDGSFFTVIDGITYPSSWSAMTTSRTMCVRYPGRSTCR